ncbi:adenosine deaminase [Saccharopolyspora spinosa]|uniref:adenosine deaminase n=1 Tax=Saccharopolyspora spinosa TaxID=60894 RepID=UPI000237B63A|nr:adenosine deaminase [Saccharopolyspora spinosa]
MPSRPKRPGRSPSATESHHPTSGPESLYDFGQFYEFIERYVQVAEAMRTRMDFAQEGYLAGNLQYREMFFNPTDHYRSWASYPEPVDGLIDGIRQAEQDFGVRCQLIPSINRMESPAAAVGMVRDGLRWRRDEVIGIGLDATSPAGRRRTSPRRTHPQRTPGCTGPRTSARTTRA